MNAHAATSAAKTAKRSKAIQPHQVPDIVSERIAAMRPSDVEALAARGGVPAREAGRLAIGFNVSAPDFLKLCAALGVDPMTAAASHPCRIGDLDRALLGAGMQIQRRLRGDSYRKAARVAMLSYSAILRVERGEITSVRTVLRACAYIGVHPFHYCADVSRESTETLQRCSEREKGGDA